MYNSILTNTKIKKEITWEQMCDELDHGWDGLTEYEQKKFHWFFERNWELVWKEEKLSFSRLKDLMHIFIKGLQEPICLQQDLR